jgi:hypothetical protein
MRLVAPDMASLKMRWHMRPEGMAVMPVSPSIHVLSVMAEWLSPELWRQSPTMRRKLRIQALRAYQAAIHEVAVPSRAADALWLEFWSDRWIWRDAPGPGEALLWLNCDPTLHDDMDFPGHCVLIVDGDRPSSCIALVVGIGQASMISMVPGSTRRQISRLATAACSRSHPESCPSPTMNGLPSTFHKGCSGCLLCSRRSLRCRFRLRIWGCGRPLR